MDQPTTPIINDDIPPTKKPWLLILVIILMFIFAALAVYFYFQNSKILSEVEGLKQELATQPPIIPTSTPASDAPSGVSTADWQEFTLEPINLTFKLPTELTHNSKWVVSTPKGETGSMLIFRPESGNSNLSIGGISPDYSVGRMGTFLDTQGYQKKNGLIYYLFVGDKTIDVTNSVINEFTNPQGLTFMIIEGKTNPDSELGTNFPIAGTPGDGSIGALLNTNNNTYPGLAISLKLSPTLTHDTFTQILSTFKFINNRTFNGQQEFKNQEFGITFIPPSGWHLDNSDNNYLMFSNYYPTANDGRSFDPNLDQGKLKLEIYRITSTESLKQFVQTKKTDNSASLGLNMNLSESPINLDSQEAIKVIHDFYGLKLVTIYAKHPHLINQQYVLLFGLDFYNNQALIDQILSTFKFL